MPGLWKGPDRAPVPPKEDDLEEMSRSELIDELVKLIAEKHPELTNALLLSSPIKKNTLD